MAHPDEDTAWETADCMGSYYTAVDELRRRWLAGEPMPEGWDPSKVTLPCRARWHNPGDAA